MTKIFLAGHNGMVGKAIFKLLSNNENYDIITAPRSKLDLLNGSEVKKFLNHHKPDQVYLAAAKVGGIIANSNLPADFIFQNLVIQNNVIKESFLAGVEKLVFLGSSCIYPKLARQPIKEEYLLTDVLEETNEAYAIAKISGIVLCKSLNIQYGTDYRCVMPTNLYGPYDNFDLENSHVVPALIRRFINAVDKNEIEISIWGTGEPRREFLHIEDMAKATIFTQEIDKSRFLNAVPARYPILNIGCGEDISIKELATLVSSLTGFKGKIQFDESKPDGTPRKLLDISRIKKLGWAPSITLEKGLKDTIKWYRETDEKRL